MGFFYRRKITIDNTQLTADVTDFALLFKGTYSWLKTVANGGRLLNGSDLGFFSDASLQTLLKFQDVKHDITTGDTRRWVRIPSASASTPTSFYIGYCNPAITTTQQDVPNTWPNMAIGYGFGDSTFLSGTDDSGNGRTMNNGGGVTATPGIVHGGGAFGASNGFMESAAAFVMNSTPNVVTLLSWVKLPAGDRTARQTIFSTTKWNTSGDWSIEIGNGTITKNGFNVIVPGTFVFGSGEIWPTDGNYHFVGFKRNGTGNTAKFYVDGTEYAVLTYNAAAFGDSGDAKCIGVRTPPSTQLWPGSIDELRVFTVTKPAEWIKAHAQTVISSNMYSVGDEEEVAPRRSFAMPQAVHRAAFWSPRPLFGWTRSRENGLWLPKTVLA